MTYLLVLSNGIARSPKSLLFKWNKESYLINCGELIVRHMVERQLLRKSVCKNILLTRNDYKNIVGLGSVTFTNLMKLHGHNIKNAKLLHDEKFMKLTYCNSNFNDGKISYQSFKFGSKEDVLTGYIIEMIGDTKYEVRYNGDNDDNMGGVRRFLVAECPTESHIDDMEASIPYETLNSKSAQLSLCCHLTDKNVFFNKKYQNILERMQRYSSTKLKHAYVDSNTCVPFFIKEYKIQSVRRHFFNVGFFPELKFVEECKENYQNQRKEESEKNNLDYFEALPNKMIFSDSKSMVPDINIEDFDSDSLFMKHITKYPTAEFAEPLREKSVDIKKSLKLSYPKITFIGTAATCTTSYTSVSSMLLEIRQNCFILIDCGYGTYYRMLTLFGQNRTNEIMRNCYMICVTHMHADHFLGLLTFCHHRSSLENAVDCLLLSPNNIIHWIKKMTAINGLDLKLQTANIDHFEGKGNDIERTKLRKFENMLSIKVNPVWVNHLHSSYGYILTGLRERKEWKLVFSGDCYPRFDDELYKQGLNCDILVHEATHADSNIKRSRQTKHSTYSHAIMAGNVTKARYTVLNHFGASKPLGIMFPERENVVSSCDFLTIDLDNLHYMKEFEKYVFDLYPALCDANVNLTLTEEEM